VRRIVAIVGCLVIGMFFTAGPVRAGAPVPEPGGADVSAGQEQAGQDEARGDQADLSVAMSASPGRARAGAALVYTITLRNNGPAPARDMSFVDRLPAGTVVIGMDPPDCAEARGVVRCRVRTVRAGESMSVRVVVLVEPSASGTLTSTARVAARTPDPVPGNDQASTATPLLPGTDLAVRLAGPREAEPGGLLRLTARVVNRGPRTASGVRLAVGAHGSRLLAATGGACRLGRRPAAPEAAVRTSSRYGAGPGRRSFAGCRLGTLRPGESRTVRLLVRMGRGPAEVAVAISPDLGDPRPGDNTGLARVRISRGGGPPGRVEP
jgi:uncharacterized repeat protein (TIGR01451 family)